MIAQCLSASWGFFFLEICDIFNISYQLHPCPKSGQPRNRISPTPDFVPAWCTPKFWFYILYIFKCADAVKTNTATSKVMVTVHMWGNASQLDNMHILSFQLDFCQLLMKEQRKRQELYPFSHLLKFVLCVSQ